MSQEDPAALAAPTTLQEPLQSTCAQRAESDELEPVPQVLTHLLGNAVPAILTNLLGFCNETTNAIFIGHYGNTHALAAIGIGNMLQNCCGLSIGIGLASALDTLVSQAHGAGQERLACVYVQRARLILLLQMIWIWPLLTWSDRWLIAIGQDPVVSRYAAEYNAMSAPFLVCWFHSSTTRRFLTAIKKPTAGVFVGAICAVMHVVWCWIFVARLGLGNKGLGLANGATWTLRAVLLSGYAWWVAPSLGLERRLVMGFGKSALHGWPAFMRVAIPALIATCSEWWYWEITALIVGYLGHEALAAHVTTQNILTLAEMVTFGLSTAAAALVGNAMGEGKPRVAKETAWCVVVVALCCWAAIAIAITFGHSVVTSMFTKDPVVKRLAGTLLLIFFWASGPTECCGSVIGGVCRGIGKLKEQTTIFLASNYCIMLPVGLLLAFPFGAGVRGVYWAMALGTASSCIAFLLVLRRADWSELSASAMARIAHDAGAAGVVPPPECEQAPEG
mmetsp:Transcript_90895/g.261946  ORF Transcript_90895/g.261946 Transcript_90895/m.261946 type:complete len:505 (-) Transcript_90895:101-1615(-)